MSGPFMVFETDDDNLNISKYNSADVQTYWSNPEHRFHYMANMRVAHRIVTSTEYLAQLLYQQTGHPDIVVAPNAVPGWMTELPLVDHLDPDFPGITMIGWAGGASHYGDWQWVKNGVKKALVKLGDKAEMHFVGVDYRKTLRAPQMAYQPWYPDVQTYWREGLYFHIGLAPLRPEPFNRSKSHIKVLEYATRGIPVVAQDYGPYSEFVVNGVTGFLVKTAKEWTEAIVTLAEDPQLRAAMGMAAHEQAQKFTIEQLWPKYLEAYTP
jgi:hypothetical protein